MFIVISESGGGAPVDFGTRGGGTWRRLSAGAEWLGSSRLRVGSTLIRIVGARCGGGTVIVGCGSRTMISASTAAAASVIGIATGRRPILDITFLRTSAK